MLCFISTQETLLSGNGSWVHLLQQSECGKNLEDPHSMMTAHVIHKVAYSLSTTVIIFFSFCHLRSSVWIMIFTIISCSCMHTHRLYSQCPWGCHITSQDLLWYCLLLSQEETWCVKYAISAIVSKPPLKDAIGRNLLPTLQQKDSSCQEPFTRRKP